MRTTVDIEEGLLVVAKDRAIAGGTSVGQLVNEALRAYLLLDPQPGVGPFELIAFGRAGGRHPSPAEVAELLENEERGPADATR